MGLDIYLLRKIYVGAGMGSQRFKIAGSVDILKNGHRMPIELDRILEVTECVGYWRKFAALHQWMLDNALNGKNDCHEHVISEDVLLKLKTDCEKIISHNAEWINRAKEIFPHLRFECASTEQLKEFLDEIHYTFNVLSNLPESSTDATYYYRASW